MVAMSVLRPLLQGTRTLLSAGKMSKAVVIRNMSEKRTMIVKPSRFEWDRWKDDVHYFLFLGLVPMALLITYVNLFVGHAELSDIPECYEPNHWEYYKGPIERWFARYIYDSPEKIHERNLHFLKEEMETSKLRKLEKKVKEVMYQRQDYKGWYFIPMDKSRIEMAREAERETAALRGSGPI
ncbi:NADH dehydrogenase [ubiquinone] 1 beta subcomplex subunit 5, mitochondrial-like [Gigantopelta aegis]|uniref:NADH dehydrogenase [ubiquinone] 1 beta subcomplex subunit 5, mitochondrial-like n=1 Tax=Gigantopelta aegis TaxID=1735272 RepID=UPI001B88AB2D|nr:NADH dehydrogenase [ubiquinone] 1 beta subcomplex subunit 5, mitochondrial-like [Gigantopelta aegis]